VSTATATAMLAMLSTATATLLTVLPATTSGKV
jgi:hypothetical protein